MTPATEPICRFSPDKRYRYTLWREVNPAGHGIAAICALNPSTANETDNDPSVRRMMGFAKDWGMRWLCVLNALGFRATDPRDMKGAPDPFGIDNASWLVKVMREADLVVAAWGTHGGWRGADVRALQCVDLAGKKDSLKCLGKTKQGHPKHPLYLRRDSQLIDYP